MPRYELKCSKCNQVREVFTLSISKMTTMLSEAEKGKINETYCVKCKQPMTIVIYPVKVDMAGDVRRS